MADPDDFRHRFTISALWGVDNQFSGKMIQEATGRTVSGVPINLAETSFDDVCPDGTFQERRRLPNEPPQRDINSESSRWSLPILIGGRIRF